MRAALVLLVWLAAVAPAAALPGDPPVELRGPAEGETLKTDADGIPVSYTCPTYRSADYGDGTGIINGEESYTVLMSDSPQLDSDGLLANPDARNKGASRPEDPNLCYARIGSTQFKPFPQVTPGKWYWQAYRICSFCNPQFETSEVRSFTLVPSTPPSLLVPDRVYAGYPFIVALAGAALPSGTDVVIERRVGSGWKEVGSTSSPSDATVVLPKGKQTLRAHAATLTSDPRTLAVKPASAKKTKVHGGKWKGGGDRATKFRVSGRTVKAFSTRVTLLCPSPGMVNPFTIQVATAGVKSFRLAPDGSFVGASTANGSVRVRGRLKGSKLSGGVVEMSLGVCTGSAKFSAKPA